MKVTQEPAMYVVDGVLHVDRGCVEGEPGDSNLSGMYAAWAMDEARKRGLVWDGMDDDAPTRVTLA